MGDHHAQARRNGQTEVVVLPGIADEHDATDERRKDVVEVPPRDARLRGERRLQQLSFTQAQAEQRAWWRRHQPRPRPRCHPVRPRGAGPW